MNFEQILKKLPFIIFLLFIILPMFKNSGFFVIFFIVALILFLKYGKQLKNFDFKNSKDTPFGIKNDSKIININNLNNMKNIKTSITFIVLAIFGLWLFFASIVIVEAGQTGVYSLFGKVRDQELRSGFHLVIPLARITKMSIRTEEYTMSIAQGEGKRYTADAITSLTKEGLSVDLDMTVLYRVEEDRASDIYRTIGLKEDIDEKVIRPTIRTAIRDVIAQYEAKDIYSEERESASSKIADKLISELEPRGIVIEQVLLRNVALPANLATAIQEKLQAEQEAEKYDFILAKEKKEKERKIIEAEGQRDAQKIINESLTQNYLYYLYINDLKSREGTIYVPTNPSTGMPLFRDLGK
ncbi:MAG: Band 7 protein [Candidatus Falkowbacteria bacterium GW2011_GWC2_38_22]|uniref:Band 7 protein n=1 Tax=Candidatus Falkowbacteria bacterium GW2011_GWE1_38_31 TaxID=1618638 RepID=A0A0G0JT45_9BACT|nr:MAG: Band 7 protein [Candidatus Falkowbacteria bacterium GW2011_GWF2_38_1205]KKQ60917.1 MAG: Band 7 protein [Candidatus Falkowbacteria bacterium GW2011_GWC2_38_22]KKQ63035.1 MAG: Band 7 protein [Candidatus Falkowbacteria bacterium GW2011_GWF1_38_22]KKQ65057.1 MAG: Band 7 protein [Candidatus Falkowbacteria bacterium GW2011_GWE2_38_254]KKQ69832.1 MAG: Band 7 protein [Candidatus Falkowbacteria bacterium GW2011_GWE1_38_31]KKQ72414.1 MAG: Band 7 protein [Candidatus Falkowbacteria bacterium GW201